MNKEVYSKFRNKKVILLFNLKKELIGYCLQKFTSNHKRVLYDKFTKDRTEAKKFLAY